MKRKTIVQELNSFENVLAPYSEEYGYISGEELRRGFSRMLKPDRSLSIGVIGGNAVESESLLNTVFFNGKPFFPHVSLLISLTVMLTGRWCSAAIDGIEQDKPAKKEIETKNLEELSEKLGVFLNSPESPVCSVTHVAVRLPIYIYKFGKPPKNPMRHSFQVVDIPVPACIDAAFPLQEILKEYLGQCNVLMVLNQAGHEAGNELLSGVKQNIVEAVKDFRIGLFKTMTEELKEWRRCPGVVEQFDDLLKGGILPSFVYDGFFGGGLIENCFHYKVRPWDSPLDEALAYVHDTYDDYLNFGEIMKKFADIFEPLFILNDKAAMFDLLWDKTGNLCAELWIRKNILWES
jgi:hypothetical protein